MPLSPLIRLGTSTWTYEGWQGQVYKRQYPKAKFAQLCLEEYAQYTYQGEPLLGCVGNDATFYRPPTASQLRRYASQVPEGFEMCCKVWEEITIPTFAKQARYGAKAGQPNPRFLDAKLFMDLVLAPYREARFEPHAGPFIFEFQRHGLPADEFLSRLGVFLAELPKDFRYAVEIRNSGLLGPSYHDTLATHGVAHVYNHWSYMPPLAQQHERVGGFTAPFTVLRLLMSTTCSNSPQCDHVKFPPPICERSVCVFGARSLTRTACRSPFLAPFTTPLFSPTQCHRRISA